VTDVFIKAPGVVVFPRVVWVLKKKHLDPPPISHNPQSDDYFFLSRYTTSSNRIIFYAATFLEECCSLAKRSATLLGITIF
jgi:1-acyl-sn-glycerol-3-phosphate acyltransferase